MPTVLRIGRLRFVIWPNDHAPPHVHVFSADGEAKIALGEPNDMPRLVENRRMKQQDLAAALEGTCENQAMLRQRWSEIHGRLGK
jgi:hypothetical protein